MPDNSIPLESPCPCRTGTKDVISFGECCHPYLCGETLPTTAEALMRSRYSAYAIGDLEYIKRTWHPDTLPVDLRLVPDQVWIDLKITRIEAGDAADSTGIVEFIAKSKRNGRARRMHEISAFSKLNNRWFYVRGDYSST